MIKQQSNTYESKISFKSFTAQIPRNASKHKFYEMKPKNWQKAFFPLSTKYFLRRYTKN